MSRGLRDSFLRYNHGEWIDCDGDPVDIVEPVRCQNCNWWHRHKSGDLSRGVCDKYAVSKNENGFCDEPLLEERKLPWKN